MEDYDALDAFYNARDNENLKITQKINYLSSPEGINHIKYLLLKEYPKEVVDRIGISVFDKSQYKQQQTQTPTSLNIGKIEKIPEELLRNGSTIQDWIKRVLSYLFGRRLVSQKEIDLLHDLDYSKETFGIAFPLLVDDYNDIFDNSENSRYWTTWKLLNRYYVCSQWWLQLSRSYERNIYAWIKKVLNI